MLTIRRVPTVVSMNQELEKAGCGLDCLGTCCIPGAKLPLYQFARRHGPMPKKAKLIDGHSASHADDSPCRPALSTESTFLDTVILEQWEDRMSRGLFCYDVTACETKVLPGSHGFVAQLNEGRHLKKRPTEFRVDQVLQPFDATKFNFTKAGQEEVLFLFEESEDGRSVYYEQADVVDSPNVVAINVSPIEYGHVLFIPRVLDCLPQKITEDTFSLALMLAVEADNPFFRVGYNSLGAFATINHLHFQAYYLAAPFPVERAPSVRVPGLARQNNLIVRLSELSEYPVRGLVFELGSSFEELSLAVARTCIELQERNFPFNVLISDRGARVFLFPQCFAERQARGDVEQCVLETGVNPAVWEISGHIVLKRRVDYDVATEEYAWKLLAEVSLAAERFDEVKTICMKAVAGVAGCILPPSLDVSSDMIRPAGATDCARIGQRNHSGSDQFNKPRAYYLPSGRPYGDISLA